MTLAEKVTAIMRQDDNAGSYSGLGSRPVVRTDDEGLNQFELDCRDWGFIFGLSFGIARGENAYESNESCAERALEAAQTAFALWGPEWHWDDRFERVAEAVR
jgi:hypothetical protein